MFKKLMLTIGFTCLFMLLLFLGYGIIEKLASKKEATAKIQTLPSVQLFTMEDSAAFKLPLSSTIVLIFFNTGCEHCQYELREIKMNLSSFATRQLVLMSSENIVDIKKASEEYGLAGLANIHFTKINAGDVFDTFGSVSVPHIFVYSKDRKLVKEFKGETKIGSILQFIQ